MKTTTQMFFAGAFLLISTIYLIVFLATKIEFFGIISLIEWVCTICLVGVTLPKIEKENKRANA